MAGGDPGKPGVERVQERGFTLPFWLGDTHVKGGPHHEALELRLHDAIGPAGTGQPEVVTPHPRQYIGRSLDSLPRTVPARIGRPLQPAGRTYVHPVKT